MAIDSTAFPAPSLPLGLPAGERARTWVARAPERGRVVGFVAGTRQGPRFYVFGIAVDEAHRGHGVGRALLRAAIAGARALRARAVALHVAVGNEPAVRLYASEGFHPVRRVSDYYRFGASRGERDAYEMLRVL
jgi:ribosomal protein S18 acetylase RimI-like enzyme